MSEDLSRPYFQPESISIENDESIFEFEKNEPEGSQFREKIWIDDLDTAKKIEKYRESAAPTEEFPKRGRKLLEEALNEDVDPYNVTSYEVRIYGDISETLGVGVEYNIGHNFETEAVANSESASSPGF